MNIADIVCCCSFAILFVFHFVHKGTFVVSEPVWRRSVPCLFVFGLSYLFSILSPSSLLFMSVSRLMVVLHPLDTQFKDTFFVKKWIFLSVVLLLLASSLVSIIYRIIFDKLPTNFCFPFIDPTDSVWFIRFITVLLFVIHLTFSLAIGMIYIKLVTHLQQEDTILKKSKSQSSTGLVIQLVVITLSNVLCWIPSGIIYISSLFVPKYPTDMPIWTTIAATPINSIMNPIVFIVSSARKHLSQNTKKVLSM